MTKLPAKGNERAECLKVMAAAAKMKPWFGIEQEYTLFKPGEQVPPAQLFNGSRKFQNISRHFAISLQNSEKVR